MTALRRLVLGGYDCVRGADPDGARCGGLSESGSFLSQIVGSMVPPDCGQVDGCNQGSWFVLSNCPTLVQSALLICWNLPAPHPPGVLNDWPANSALLPPNLPGCQSRLDAACQEHAEALQALAGHLLAGCGVEAKPPISGRW